MSRDINPSCGRPWDVGDYVNLRGRLGCILQRPDLVGWEDDGTMCRVNLDACEPLTDQQCAALKADVMRILGEPAPARAVVDPDRLAAHALGVLRGWDESPKGAGGCLEASFYDELENLRRVLAGQDTDTAPIVAALGKDALLAAAAKLDKLAAAHSRHTEDPGRDVRAASTFGKCAAYEHAAMILRQMAAR